MLLLVTVGLVVKAGWERARDPQPGYPIRAAFYYGWYPESWTQLGSYPFTQYRPSLGYYDSADPAVIRQHLAAMQYAHIAAGIFSWWGQNTPTDRRLPLLLAAAAGSPFRWAVYHENEGSNDPTVAQLHSDLLYLRDHYGHDPSYLRIDGRFVVFVYADRADGCAMAGRWQQANTVNAYLVLKVFPNYTACPYQPAAWHQYAPSDPADPQLPFSYTISPGFAKFGEPARLARNLARWRQNIRDMIASRARFQLISTFNEWGEGTAVEPATQWPSPSGYGPFLDALHNDGAEPLLLDNGF